MNHKLSIYNKIVGYAHWVAACAIIMLTFAVSPISSAQSNSHISKTSVSELVGNEPAVLNWKTNDIVIPFDLPGTVWVDKVEVLISARPTGELRHRRNLRLRVNGAKPVILKSQGQRFDARVTLEQRHLRQSGNKLYISGISTTSTCASPNHAGWEIDKDNSMVVFYGRNMTRDLRMRDIASMFNRPSSKTTNLGLKVVGTDNFRNEALITQGITLRTGEIPQLRTAFSGNDIDIVAGVRTDIERYIRRESSRDGTGPQIILDKNRPPRIILTGDSPLEVREAVNAFAKHKLPLTRRVEIRPTEMTLQPILSNQRVNFQKTHKISDAGAIRPASKWVTSPLSFKFDTSYAAQRSGELILRLNSDKTLSELSSLSVELNNRPLGQTNIDARRKTVRLNIPEGYLIGADNNLVITSDLRPDEAIPTCDVARTTPGFNLGIGSKLSLGNRINKNIHDVSNIASKNGPFALSKNVAVINTATKSSDRLSTLRLMAHMAYLSGSAWTHAEFIEASNGAAVPDTENILIVGPQNRSIEPLLANAPKALRLALNGQKIPNIPEQQAANVIRVAALDKNQAFKLAVSSAQSQAKRYASGLISTFDDPVNAQTISIITAYQGGSFKTAAQNLIKPEVWNSLSGSVAQWDSSGAHMLQIAQPKLLTNSEPLYENEISLANLITLDWEAFGTVHDDMMESLYKIWEKPASAIGGFIENTGRNLETKWESVVTGINNEPRRLRENPIAANDDILTNPAKAETQSPRTRLRGTITPRNETAASTEAYISSPNGTDFTDRLSAGFSNIESGALSAVNSIKTFGQDSYKNFDIWVESVNRKRRAQGQPPIATSPVLALLILICAGLILMGLAKPHQR